MLPDDARGRGHRTLAEKAFETLQQAITTGQFQACHAHDPDRAARALHDHLVATADNIADAMGGAPLYQLDVR